MKTKKRIYNKFVQIACIVGLVAMLFLCRSWVYSAQSISAKCLAGSTFLVGLAALLLVNWLASKPSET